MKANWLEDYSTAALLGLIIAVSGWAETRAATLPEGFEETVVFTGINAPTTVRFAPDGRVFVAGKDGVITVFNSLDDPTRHIFADLNGNVYNFWDRGLLGMALDPNFSPTNPWVYVLYTYDSEGFGTPDVYADPCPTPPGATTDGCLAHGRLSVLEADFDADPLVPPRMIPGSERVLIEDWCQQYPSHSIGDLEFGPDGMLYVSGGDGASFNFVDYGQDGQPLNPCDDPPTGIGGTQTAPTAEGGALRSQDLRTNPDGENLDPVALNGAILRVDPATGDAVVNGLEPNPLADSADLNARRIIAYGLRNPFRIEFRPGTDELWIGDVGWADWEEINVIDDVNDAVVENFGWPCYEGNGGRVSAKQSGYDGANLNICENLYAQGSNAVDPPYHAYHHSAQVVAGETCPTGSSAIAGLQFEFYDGIAFPAEYEGALFFADNGRDCIWAIFAGPDGRPDRGRIQTFVAGASNPVDLEMGPDGDLYYADYDGGAIRRIHFFEVNAPPVAVVSAGPPSGPDLLTFTFDGTDSSDADGDLLTYNWDLDGDGELGDSSASQPSHTYAAPGDYTVTLQVSDGELSDSATVTIHAGNTPPVASIDAPAAGTTWGVDDVIEFSGSGTDAEDGPLPASALSWSLIMHHCPDNCHTHIIEDFVDVASGDFAAPDHEYPSFLELRLTVTDSASESDTASLELDPATVLLTFQTKPGGLDLVVGSTAEQATFSRTVIAGSHNSISAPSPQVKGRNGWTFQSWSDGVLQAQRDIIAPDFDETYRAEFVK